MSSEVIEVEVLAVNKVGMLKILSQHGHTIIMWLLLPIFSQLYADSFRVSITISCIKSIAGIYPVIGETNIRLNLFDDLIA